MTLCWSCERDAGDGALCVQCGTVLPPRAREDFFAVMGLPAQFPIELRAAESRFRELSRQFHPDRFAKADPRARQASLQRSVQLNEAWRTLRDPVGRAEYLLEQLGYDVAGEAGATGPAEAGAMGRPAVAGAPRVRIPVSPVLLGEILELREALVDARAEGDVARIGALAEDVRQRIDMAMRAVGDGFARADAVAGAGGGARSSAHAAALESVAQALIELRYYKRFLAEVPSESDAESPPSSSPGAPGRGEGRGD